MTRTAKDTARPFGVVMGAIVVLIAVFGTLAGLHSTTATPAKSATHTASSAQVQPTPHVERGTDEPSESQTPDRAAPRTSEPPHPPTTHRDTSSVYVVRPGDTLWDIARAHYGNGLMWHQIAATNNLTHPQLIYPGDRLTL